MHKILMIFRSIVMILLAGPIMLSFVGCEKADPLEENKNMVRGAVEEIINQGKLDAVDDYFAKEYIRHPDPNFKGAGDIKKTVKAVRASFPDYHFAIEDMIAEGDKVVTRYTSKGIHKAEFMGVPPSGKEVTATGIIISRIANGKIVEEWQFKDTLAVLQQLGVISIMPEAPLAVMKRTKPEEFIWSVPSKVTGDPGDPETNKALVRREEEEVWNQRKLESFDTFFSTKFINHDPGFPDIRDYQGYKEFWTTVGQITEDYHLTVEDMVAEGDRVAVRWSSRLIALPAKQPVNNRGILIYRLADKKIVEAWFCTDMLAFMQQMGILPAPAE